MKKNIIIMLCVGAFLTFVSVNYLFKCNLLSLHCTIPSSHTQKTFAIIKPDAVAAKNTGKIIDIIEDHGFEIINLKKLTLSPEQAQKFYAVHKEKPFFNELITFMTSGPVIVMALKKDNAVQAWRDLMGSTNPTAAQEGTLRKLFGTDITHNAVHGSDSPENAITELEQFFS